MSLNNEEFKEIKFNANELYMTPSSYAKKLTLGHSIIQPKMSLKSTQNIYYQLKKIGNNLNQLAKITNQNKVLIDHPKRINKLANNISQLTDKVELICQRLK